MTKMKGGTVSTHSLKLRPTFQPLQAFWRPNTAFALQQDGFIVLQVLVYMILLNLIAFTLFSLSIRMTQIERLHHAERQAYWLARSQALREVQALQAGESVVQKTIQISPRERINVTSSGADTISVTVVAVTPLATDGILLKYDTVHRKVISWTDNTLTP